MSSSRHSLTSSLFSLRGGGITRWFLLTGARWQVLLALMGTIFGTLLVLALLNPYTMRQLLADTTAVKTLFSSLLSGAILLVSVVVSINSVILSDEMVDLEDQHRRIDASIDYHNEIEDLIHAEITPARPADFLSAVLYALSQQVLHLTDTAEDQPDEEFRNAAGLFADSMAEEIERARTTLSAASMGSFEVLLTGLNFNYSGELHAARGLRHTYGDSLDEESRAAIDEVISTLKYVGSGREYFKSLYYKRELAHLSSRLLFVSLPVIVFSSYMLLALNTTLFPELTYAGFSPLVLFVSLAYTIALAPYLLLTAYIIRAATITIRTLAAGPFILQRGSDIQSLEWDPEIPDEQWALAERLESDD